MSNFDEDRLYKLDAMLDDIIATPTKSPEVKQHGWYQMSAHTLKELIADLRDVTKQKDGAYAERDQLVALLSKLFPASLERHPDSDTTWDDDWRWIVFIQLPTGQASWHIHDSELPMFDHLLRETGQKWDGHSTEQKYERVAQLKPSYRTIGHFREGQEIYWQGADWTLAKISPYGEDYLFDLERFKGRHLCVVPLSVYNEALARETQS